MSSLWTFVSSVWWRWDAAKAEAFDGAYHALNLIEGACWLLVAVLVVVRQVRRGGGPLNAPYAAAFLLFGLSDFVEAFQLSTALIVFKGANLAAIAILRRAVIRRYYPGSRAF